MGSPTSPFMSLALLPTATALAAWTALTRDQQLTSLRAYLAQADCDRVSGASIASILAVARVRTAARRG
jgi:hypothetical protein